MFLADVVNSGVTPALEKMLAFTEARHRVLTENVANVDTPGYKTRQLDAGAFQESLRQAIGRRKQSGAADLAMRATREFRTDRSGRLVVTPTLEPPENILFHDQTNQRIERQMASLAENAMMHEAATELLRGRFESLLKAIRGRV